jgi:hypothetical protein
LAGSHPSSIVNFGGIVVQDTDVGGARPPRQKVLLANFEQKWQVAKRTKLLSEINWKTSDTAGEPYRLAWNAGFGQKAARWPVHSWRRWQQFPRPQPRRPGSSSVFGAGI